MAAINPDWYAGNATRAYPLDDAATARDDAGRELPPQILVDCRVRFPSALGRFAYIGGVTVGPNIVTAVIMATSNAVRPPGGAPVVGADAQPLGAVTLPRPVSPNRHYPIQPMADGVGGWLVFGRGIDEPYSGRFSSASQSLLLPRVAAAYDPLPIPSLGKLGLDPPLTGVVQLLGGTDLEVVQDTCTIDGAEITNAVVIRLIDSLNRNVFDLYKGPCGGRPESHTCDKPALEAINTVAPDCDGDLTIEFQGVNVVPFAGGGGLALDLELGMADTCVGQDYLPDATGKLPGQYDSQCPPPPTPAQPPPDAVLPPSPLPLDCAGLPYYESFDSVIPTAWKQVVGDFIVEDDDSPGEPYGGETPGSGPPAGHIPGFAGLPPLHRAAGTPSVGVVPINKSYSAVNKAKRNVSIWDCDYDAGAMDLLCTTHLKLMPGPQINGGVVMFYVANNPKAANRTTYSTISVNMTTNFMEIGAYNGTAYVGYNTGYPFPVGGVPVVGDWYQLMVRTRPSPDQLGQMLFSFRLRGVTNPAFPKMEQMDRLVVSSWGQAVERPPKFPNSKYGLGTFNAACRFSFFQLEPTPSGGFPP